MFRPIAITAVLNGWIVTIGCQTVVYQSREMLLADLSAYMQWPEATEDRFLSQAVNRAHTMGGAVPTPMGGTTVRYDGAFPDSPGPTAPPPTGEARASTAYEERLRTEQSVRVRMPPAYATAAAPPSTEAPGYPIAPCDCPECTAQRRNQASTGGSQGAGTSPPFQDRPSGPPHGVNIRD